jgi:SET domain
MANIQHGAKMTLMHAGLERYFSPVLNQGMNSTRLSTPVSFFLVGSMNRRVQSTGRLALDPKDLSHFYFASKKDNDPVQQLTTTELTQDYDTATAELSPEPLYYVGPVQVVGDDRHDGRGRRLVTTTNVEAGELLFITSPVVTAPVHKVHQLWQEQQASDISAAVKPALSLQEIAEEVLLNECQRLLDPEMEAASSTASDHQQSSLHGAQCFLAHCLSALEGIHPEASSSSSVPSLARLLGLKDAPRTTSNSTLTNEELRQIIRRNAFGPDFVTLQSLERKWGFAANDSANETTNTPWLLPATTRVLGLYPLAAMINHSCLPNALRVYAQWPPNSSSLQQKECMVVHACHDIAAGHEVVWSYMPPVQPVRQRQTMLHTTHGFVCTCPRCTLEWTTEMPLLPLGPEIISHPNHQLDSITTGQRDALLDRLDQLDVTERVPFLENVWATSTLSNEQKRYGRTSYLSYYIQHFNTTVTCGNEWDDSSEAALTLATHVHLALAASHNASTEHLSVRNSTCARPNTMECRRRPHLTASFLAHMCTGRFCTCATTWPVLA